jgi:hypothetical protein
MSAGDTGIFLDVDRDQYVARPESGASASVGFRVVATFVNATNGAVELRRCLSSDAHPRHRLELKGSEQASAYDAFRSCTDPATPLRVAARAIHLDTLAFSGTTPDAATGQPAGVVEGTFAIVYELARCPTGETCPPWPRVESPSFRVTRRP